MSGSTEESGPATMWCRLTSPVTAGTVPSPFVTVATLADLGAAAGWEHSPEGVSHINPDLTLQLARCPRGDWVAIEGRNHHAAGGVGFNEVVLHDHRGPIGRVLQSLVASPIDLG